jgi:hypothetical protein
VKTKTRVKEIITKDWLVKILLALLTWFASTTWHDVRDTRDRLIVVETKVDRLLPDVGPPINPMGGSK